MNTALWHEVVFPTATALKILRGRLKSIDSNGRQGDCAGCGSVLVAFGEDNAKILEECDIEGKFIRL